MNSGDTLGMPPARGKVYLVGAGPGAPDLLTVRAHKLLRDANVVLHDDLVPPAILSLAGRHAEVVNVGKRCGAKGATQEEINARMIEAARRGLEVVRLKSGDPGIFGRLAEELDALGAANVPFEVVPGITAALAAAASLGVSLTDRRKSSRVIVMTGHRANETPGQRNASWGSLAAGDATLVFYMPGQDYGALQQELLDAGVSREIPAVIVSRAAMAGQRQHYTTIGQLGAVPHLEAPAIILIGSSLEHAEKRSNVVNLSLSLDCADLILS